MRKERNEETYHRLSWAEFEERYGESPADFEEERDKSLYQLECEAAGIPY
jgi:hypothetical protein